MKSLEGKSLEGKVAFITGASRGIGAAVARAFSGEGVKLGLASRSGDDLGLPEALGLQCDVRDATGIEAAVSATVAASAARTSALAGSPPTSLWARVAAAGRACPSWPG